VKSLRPCLLGDDTDSCFAISTLTVADAGLVKDDMV
jgi:hypothetical protein